MVTAISRNRRGIDDDEEAEEKKEQKVEEEEEDDRMGKGGYCDETSEIDRKSHYAALLHRKFPLSDG